MAFPDGPMTDEAFAQLCTDHPDLELEMSADGELIVMPLRYTLTGARNAEISAQLGAWAHQDKRGCAFGSSTGLVLPNGARRSPDASWVLASRIRALEHLDGFWRLCPDFVIELRCLSGGGDTLRAKMREWIDNGAQPGWLIDPETRTVEIYRPDREAETRSDVRSVAGEGPVEGFVLELGPVWDPLPGYRR
jgi:Uma2 family endonuclease